MPFPYEIVHRLTTGKSNKSTNLPYHALGLKGYCLYAIRHEIMSSASKHVSLDHGWDVSARLGRKTKSCLDIDSMIAQNELPHTQKLLPAKAPH